MIRFNDFFKDIPNPLKTKVKFNMNAGDVNKRAWDLLLDDDFGWIEMNSWKTKQSNNNLNHADYLIALAQYYPYGPEYFVFGGLYKVEKNLPEVYNAMGYTLTLMDEYNEYIKRLIIKIDKPIGRDIYNRMFMNLQKLNPEIYELSPDTKMGHFNGYQNVSLNYNEMKQIFSRNEPSWKEALSHVKGVYVITDTNNGRLYIGSASGNTDGIWQRWAGYADDKNLTNGNIELEEVAFLKGKDYIKDYFTYSIIEIFDTKTKIDTILERESYWKKVFDTRKNGLNRN